MNDEKYSGETSEGFDEQQGETFDGSESNGEYFDESGPPVEDEYDMSGPPDEDFDAPEGSGAESQQDWSGEEKRTNVPKILVALVILIPLIAGGIIFFNWYQHQQEADKWSQELKTALTLPDGKYEEALRSILEKSNHEEVLAQAAFELGVARDKGGIKALTQAVSKGGVVGREAAKALAKIGGAEAKIAIEPIFQQMNLAKDELPKAEYAWALCTLGDARGFAPLLNAFAKKLITPKSVPEFDPDVIIRIGTTPKLIELAASPEPMLRMYAALELGYRTDQDVIPALTKLVKDEKMDVAEAAAISLGRTADDRAGPVLIQTMQEKKSLRDSILNSITQTVGSPGLEMVYKNIGDDVGFKYTIMGKVKKLADPRSKDFLWSVMQEKFPETNEETKKQAKEIHDQALWTLELLGDPRISEAMYQKTKWEPATEAAFPDPAMRYRQDENSRRIANAVAPWFSKVKPEGAIMYVKKIYDDNAPYSNTPECAQRVKVDIGPIMDAMGKLGDQSFCPIIEPFLDQDEGFYFQAAAMALGRLKCKGVMKSFMKRMQMTKEERKEKKFGILEETRDWMMEDRLQERRNSIIALKFFGSGEPGKELMKIALDVEDDLELRKEAAISLAYCANEKVVDDILLKIKDTKIDIIARADLIEGLWFKPSDKVIEAMFEILEGAGDDQLVAPAAVVIGEAGNPAYDERLNKLLDHPDEIRRRAAVFAILLGGNTDRLKDVIAVMQGTETRLVVKEWYEEHQLYLTRDMFDSKRLFRRLVMALALLKKTEGTPEEIRWPWKNLMDRIKSAWEDGPDGLTDLAVRDLLVETVRNDDLYRDLAAQVISGMGERGILLALQGEKGPHSVIARDVLRTMTAKVQ